MPRVHLPLVVCNEPLAMYHFGVKVALDTVNCFVNDSFGTNDNSESVPSPPCLNHLFSPFSCSSSTNSSICPSSLSPSTPLHPPSLIFKSGDNMLMRLKMGPWIGSIIGGLHFRFDTQNYSVSNWFEINNSEFVWVDGLKGIEKLTLGNLYR